MRLRATTFIRNDAMIEARKKMGWSQKELASVCGVSFHLIQRLESLNFPTRYDEVDIGIIADFLNLEIEAIYPIEMQGWRGHTTFLQTLEVSTEKLIDFAERQASRFILPSPAEIAEKRDFQKYHIDILKKAMKCLSFRERKILDLRYGLEDGHCYTLAEVGRIFKVTQERIREVEAKAIRRLENMLSSPVMLAKLKRQKNYGKEKE
jgi:RNA polymerase sigma factor (sigma-70 family)